jgi:hypothetical protein
MEATRPTARPDRSTELAELVRMEVQDIVATANEEGFSAAETLDALMIAVTASKTALAQDPDPADDPVTLV